jgi:large subunit ribosomal protein L10
MTAHVSQKKKNVVKSLIDEINKYKIVGAVNVEGLPSGSLQKMRNSLRKDNVKIIMTKGRLIKVALKESKKEGLVELSNNLIGMPALILTNDNPFKLFKQLNRSKSQGPAKAGQVAPKDVIVKAGPTAFSPGPIIGELGAVGIKAGINAGKVEIKQDVTVLREGQVFTPQLAGILTRLQIFPMEIGLNLTAAFENGIIYTKSVLSVDEKEYIDKVTTAATWALNLSVEAGIYNKDNVEICIQNAASNARNLAVDATIYAADVIEMIIAKANNHAQGLASEIPEDAR